MAVSAIKPPTSCHASQGYPETAPRISAHELFAQWDAEAAHMIDEEREPEDRQWDDFQKGINETRAELEMRPL